MRFLFALSALAAVACASAPVQAQTSPVEARVDRLEREMRAVQRKVFPGGAGQTFEPQIAPESNTTVPGLPASSPVADLTQRVASLEGQVATLTGQVEQMQYRLKLMEDAFSAYKRSNDIRVAAVEDKTAGNVPAPVTVPGPSTVPAEATVRPPVSKPPVSPPPAADKPQPATGNRAQQVAAIERPSTGDAAEDQYVYGYRLWSAKLYPEARKELEQVATKYPKHRRASWAQNLLGRAYLDAGAPSLAAVAFYQNYKTNPNGERAPDSLFYLAQALTQLKKPAAEICKVYGELTQNYGDRISEEMKARVAEGRTRNKCK
ncbi:tol-pal system YbgF family protein [Sphingomonas canadensis]|uniref:Tol-pal system YbgF family protein n=1 Tax=Sphingomonas canadensis TaxID=1219257 RepID=A0ABW3H1W4_9SPHN|nr:tetratricopeptide repeat protein [Sphingomonas canadensis]MCW3834644.1 hypothetical protein [Sphingomonas canadensis]